ncbi:hypothetical protein IE53DRAFT_366276 [Violaceomyces palustris]|uniref:Uncharacterized protein n=1 Tax=Violaceomyces palustris TaxID=1673888 RepID=A0ACD0P6A8_9BASI|nr:hypothetical protein IE53DRAFT_366276 [Violaceomyces palustris]
MLCEYQGSDSGYDGSQGQYYIGQTVVFWNLEGGGTVRREGEIESISEMDRTARIYAEINGDYQSVEIPLENIMSLDQAHHLGFA